MSREVLMEDWVGIWSVLRIVLILALVYVLIHPYWSRLLRMKIAGVLRPVVRFVGVTGVIFGIGFCYLALWLTSLIPRSVFRRRDMMPN